MNGYSTGVLSAFILYLAVMMTEMFNAFTSADGKTLTMVAIISHLAWGLGYFGQPHILVRFMAIRSSKETVCLVWLI